MYNPNQLEKIFSKDILKGKITPFNESFQITTLNKTYQALKNKKYKYNEYGMVRKWWESSEFGKQVSLLSLQHGIVGVNSALSEKTFKNIKMISRALKHNSKYSYSDSYLFGSAGLLWEYGYEFGKNKITIAEFESIVNQIIKSWNFGDNNIDFALGIAGKLYSIIFTLLLDDKLNTAKEVAKILHTKLKKRIGKNHISFSTTFDRINFAHGLSGTAYVLLISSLYFNDEQGIKIAKEKFEVINNFLINDLEEDFSTKGYMYFSWCEGLSGIGRSLIRAQRIFNNSIQYKSIDLIFSNLQRNGLKVDGCWCHGRSSIINFFLDVYLTQKNDKAFNNIKSLVLYEFSTAINLKDNILNFVDETGYLNSFDFGVGQVGILRTLLDALNKKDPLFFLTGEQENKLSREYFKIRKKF